MTTTEATKPTKPKKLTGTVPAKPKEQFVTKAEFSQMTDVLSQLVNVVTELKNKPAPTPEASKEAEEIRKAKHDQAPMNPAWDEKSREIIGEAVDHCEVFYPRNGGTIFTVVIKPEFSNAPKEYLAFNKVDRRSREIGSEGIAGVETWCKLIRQNLKRTANN